MSTGEVELRYLIRDGRIRVIWTRKSNSVFVFGPWIRYSIGYKLFLVWAYLYFETLAFRKINFLAEAD